jgi:5-methylcytosine-specific restriction endonuclease McrA
MDVKWHSQYNLKRYHSVRAEYIQLLGGKCTSCGSEKNLHFDHIKSEDKEFNIGDRLTYPREYVLKELEKCQLLCAKCHIAKTRKSKDGYDKRAKGEQISHAKLTEALVKEIKEKMKTEPSNQVLAEEYNVERGTMWYIRKGKTWKHV